MRQVTVLRHGFLVADKAVGKTKRKKTEEVEEEEAGWHHRGSFQILSVKLACL